MWFQFFLIIFLVAVIAYLTGVFKTKHLNINGAAELNENIMKYKQLMDSDIIVDDAAVIELGERLEHQATDIGMKDEYLSEINEVKENLLLLHK